MPRILPNFNWQRQYLLNYIIRSIFILILLMIFTDLFFMLYYIFQHSLNLICVSHMQIKCVQRYDITMHKNTMHTMHLKWLEWHSMILFFIPAIKHIIFVTAQILQNIYIWYYILMWTNFWIWSQERLILPNILLFYVNCTKYCL